MQQITVDEYILKNEKWSELLQKLRRIILSTGLQETVKWRSPVYTVNNKNVVGIGAFKSYAGIWFFHGALLKDTQGKLINAQERRTIAMRQWCFQSAGEIDQKLVKAYVVEAVQNQKKGKAIKPVRNKPLIIPDELITSFKENPAVEKCFDRFTLSQKREYAEYIIEAKKRETKIKRIVKIIPMIVEGKGLNDKYRK